MSSQSIFLHYAVYRHHFSKPLLVKGVFSLLPHHMSFPLTIRLALSNNHYSRGGCLAQADQIFPIKVIWLEFEPPTSQYITTKVGK